MTYNMFVLIFVFLACSVASADVTRPLVVFDQTDRPCDVVDVSFTRCGPVDRSGRYKIVFVTPHGASVQVSSGWQGRHSDVIVAFVGRRSDGTCDPIASWTDSRIFVRDAADRKQSWEGLEAADSTRKALFDMPPQAEWPMDSVLWGLKLPASMRKCDQLEMFLAPRPIWQRSLCKKVSNISSGPMTPMSRLKSTCSEQQTVVQSDHIVFQNKWLKYAGSEVFFFVPSGAVNEGDTGALEGLVSWSCTGENPAEELFPSVLFESRVDGNREPVLRVGVGGETTVPSPFVTMRGSILFPDGASVDFEGSLLNGCVVEWPTHCGVSGVFSVSGNAYRSDGTSAPLKVGSYELSPVDRLWSKAYPYRASRLGANCGALREWSHGGTISVRIPADGRCF